MATPAKHTHKTRGGGVKWYEIDVTKERVRETEK